MPFLLLIGLGTLITGLMATGGYLLTRVQRLPSVPVDIGARPPLAYRGDPIFSIPQERWGKVECVVRAGQGYCYGVRLRNGNAVVLRDYEVTR